jgi:ubiquinone/menaquinone biosynthesis C-methylase UbiE
MAVCPDARGVVASAYDLPWADDQFDLVLTMEVLEHLEDPQRALREIARVSRRYVIASVPNEPVWRILNMLRGAYLKDFGNTPGHVQHFSPRAFRRLLETELEIIDTCRPLPWQMALCRVPE